ncbi:hypothetical protein GJ744_004689 [Endocarpon pusillum]|uniref:Uncharacterized protein n=1 Tax=Endocarpon pusillum TaxID=364733 RepID=A0A8H7E1J1_9EURO|nr:hypothetical protein GJ744_004689 [Endocarpon pusillum]
MLMKGQLELLFFAQSVDDLNPLKVSTTLVSCVDLQGHSRCSSTQARDWILVVGLPVGNQTAPKYSAGSGDQASTEPEANGEWRSA